MPRAVTKASSEALEAHARSCPHVAECPQPVCRAPPFATYPACVQGKCVSKVREGKQTEQ
jgi:hypothetical protein